MCPSVFCRLCLCSSTEVKNFVDENGQYNDIYEITAKYFDPMLLTTVICVDCWQHIHEFYEFQQSVLRSQAKLHDAEKNEPLVKLEMVLIDQDENDNITEVEDDNPPLFDSSQLTEYNPFGSDDEIPLAEYSTSNISIINCKEENIKPAPHDSSNKDEHKFKCSYCGRTFKLARDLRQHTATHTGQAFYECPLCSTKCTQYKNIRRHIQNLHPKEYVELGYHQPNALTKLYSQLKEQSVQPDHDDESKFKCPFCRSKVSHEKNLPRHIRALHPEKYDGYLLEIQILKLKQETDKYDDDDDDKIKFKCPYCPKKFLQKKNIRRHIKATHPEEYVEHSVDVTRVDLNLLGQHAGKNEAIDEDLPNYDDYDAFITKWKEELECEICKKTFTSFGLLRRHFKVEHPDDKCHITCCEYKIPTRSRLVDHIRFHLDPNSFKCKICGKCLAHGNALYLHMKTHNEQRPYQCNVCGKSFRKKDKLITHSGIHITEINHFCKVCGKGFSTKRLLRKHEYIHTRNLTRLCEQCGKCFQSVIELENHVLQHAGTENPKNFKLPCDLCGGLYKSRTTLAFHKKTCHSDTVYVCSECGKKFASMLYLKLHNKRTHRGEVKFKCTICGKELKSVQSLHAHEITHTAKPQYQCPHCPLKLKQKKNMPRHIQIAHPSEFKELKLRHRTKVDLSLVDQQIVI